MESVDNLWPYVRKSRALDDLSDPHVLSHQETALLRLCSERGWEVEKDQIIRELGSGETIESRPRFRAWLQMAEKLPSDHGGMILVTALDRLSRGSMRERGWIADVLMNAHILIVTPGSTYDLRNPDHLMVFGVISSVAHYSLGRYKQDVQLRFKELRERGRSINLSPPFGYRRSLPPNDPDISPRQRHQATLRWERHPDRWPILLAWLADIDHLGVGKIAAKYGVSQCLVYDTLTNPAIAGYPHRRYGSARGVRDWHTKDGSPPMMLLPRDQWEAPLQPGDYPPACTWERWQQIQQILASRRNQKSGRGDNSNGWCRDVIRFTGYPDLAPHLSCLAYPPDDDRHLTYEIRPRGEKTRYVPRAQIHRHVEAMLIHAFQQPDLIAWSLDRYRRQQEDEKEIKREQHDLTAIQRTLEDHREQLVVLELRAGRGDEEQQRANEKAQERLREAIVSLKAAVAALARPVVSLTALDSLESNLRLHLGDLEEWWQSADGDLRRKIVGAFVLAVLVETTPVPGQLAWRREIVRSEYQPWLSLL